jgi:3-hydroxypropanoate dehydrogenase
LIDLFFKLFTFIKGLKAMATISKKALQQLFTNAHSVHKFSDKAVTDEVLHALYDLVKLGPTGFNSQTGRYLFVRSKEAKERLAPALSSSNREKTLSAPVNVIIAYDTKFHEHLPEQFPAYDAKSFFDKSPTWIEPTAKLNATLQAGYLIIAARALGLSVGPMSGFNPTLIDNEFFADGRYKSLLLANLGYDVDNKSNKRGPRLTFEQSTQII